MQDEQIKPGSLWARKSNSNYIARVLWTEDGYVRYEAAWSRNGDLGKAADSFLAHYVPVKANGILSRPAR